MCHCSGARQSSLTESPGQLCCDPSRLTPLSHQRWFPARPAPFFMPSPLSERRRWHPVTAANMLWGGSTARLPEGIPKHSQKNSVLSAQPGETAGQPVVDSLHRSWEIKKQGKLATVLTCRTEIPITTCPCSTLNKQHQGGRRWVHCGWLHPAVLPSARHRTGPAAAFTSMLLACIYFHPIRKNTA